MTGHGNSDTGLASISGLDLNGDGPSHVSCLAQSSDRLVFWRSCVQILVKTWNFFPRVLFEH